MQRGKLIPFLRSFLMLSNMTLTEFTILYFLYSLVYVWGYNGYCRLGLGDQKDVLAPKVVPQVIFIFLHVNAVLSS